MLTLGFAFGALAYIPSVGSLLRRAAARVEEGGKSREAMLAGRLQLGAGQPLPATLTLHFPLTCRLEAKSGSVTVKGDPTRPQIKEEGVGDGARDLLRLACPLVAYRGQSTAEAEKTLRAAAAAAGAAPELTPTGLARLYDRVAVILGASPRQLDRPQLWLYKDTSAPARLVSRQGDTLDDLRLLQYGNPASADWFPRVIELWRGEALVARFEALETHGFHDVAEDEDADDPKE